MSQNVTPIRANQVKAIESMLTGANITKAANAAGVTRQTVTRWLSEPAFRLALANAEAEALAAVARSMAGNADKAAAALVSILDAPEASDRDKIAAARVFLASLPTVRLLGSIEVQLSELREANNQ